MSKNCAIFKTQVAISALVKSHPESCHLEAICPYHDTVSANSRGSRTGEVTSPAVALGAKELEISPSFFVNCP